MKATSYANIFLVLAVVMLGVALFRAQTDDRASLESPRQISTDTLYDTLRTQITVFDTVRATVTVYDTVRVQATGQDAGATFHTVRTGDFLLRIAQQYGVTVQELRSWNKLGRRQYLHPGDRLVVRDTTTARAPEPVETVETEEAD